MTNPFYYIEGPETREGGDFISEAVSNIVGEIISVKTIKNEIKADQIQIIIKAQSPFQVSGKLIRDTIPIKKDMKWKMAAYYHAVGFVTEDNHSDFQNKDVSELMGCVIAFDSVQNEKYINVSDVRSIHAIAGNLEDHF